MKNLFFDFIWQYQGGDWIDFNPIGIEFEYEKLEPSLTFKFIIMGIGFQILWICPWQTKESEYAQECSKKVMEILSMEKDMPFRDRSGE